MSLTLATLTVGGGKPVPVHFNPASLRVTTSNQFDEKVPNQVSKPTSFKLDVELLFDSTETGADIHLITQDLRSAATATGEGAVAHNDSGGAAKDPGKKNSHLQLVTLTWGTRRYQGYVESLNETLDYWTSDGVPLRATMQISIKGTSKRFFDGKFADIANYKENKNVPQLPKVVMTPAAKDDTEAFLKLAREAGDRSSGRGLAAMNGFESMRAGVGFAASASASAGFAAGASASASASAGAGFAMGGGAQLQAAAGFKLAGGVSAGASVGFGMGASAGLSAGAGLGASVGVGMAAGAGIGLGGGAGIGGGIGIGAGASVGLGLGVGGTGGGFGVTTSTSVTGFDGVTTTKTDSSFTGLGGTTRSSATTSTAGVSASAGAFAGLGSSRTTLPGAGFDPDSLLPPPAPTTGAGTSYDVSGRAVGGGGQVAASYSARAGVTVW